MRRWRRCQERQNHLLLRCGEAGKAVLQEFAQLRVLLTQAVESGPGLIWRAAEVDASLCQDANARGQRGFRCSIHTWIPSLLPCFNGATAVTRRQEHCAERCAR